MTPNRLLRAGVSVNAGNKAAGELRLAVSFHVLLSNVKVG